MRYRLSTLLIVANVGCYGGIGSLDSGNGSDDPASTDTDGAAGDSGTPAGESGGDPEAVPPVAPPPASCALRGQRLYRMSSRHYGHALVDLLGLERAPILTSVSEAAQALVPAGTPFVDLPVALELRRVAQASVAKVEEQLRTETLCDSDEDEQTCARRYLEQTAHRAFRRPIEADELDDLMAVFTAGRATDLEFEGAVGLGLQAIIQAPSFLYRRECGSPSDAGVVLSGYEIASVLGFLLLDSVPDQELLEAAKSGQLGTQDSIREVVASMLERPDVQAHVTEAYLRWARVFEVLEIDRDAPEFSAELAQSMLEETRMFVDDVLWRRSGRLSELLTSSQSFVDDALAELYGVQGPQADQFDAVMLPPEQRAGLLTHASVLSVLARRDGTSTIKRGLFVTNDLMCSTFPPPPPEAAEESEAGGETERSRAIYRMETAPCSSCHAQFESYGMVSEGYDLIGRFHPDVDATWSFPPGGVVEGDIRGPVELGSALSTRPEVLRCVAQRMLSSAFAQTLGASQSCQFEGVASSFEQSEGDLVGLIVAVAGAPVLRMRDPGVTE